MLAAGARYSPSAFASPSFGSYVDGAAWPRRRVSRASLLGFPLTIPPGPSPEANSAPRSGSTADVADTVWMALASFAMPFGKQKTASLLVHGMCQPSRPFAARMSFKSGDA
ncbi:hypothetical protein BM1_10545 [Bipolaris maydis]|nr:hypothetical protein BM1_10545 [Bipolaris maydis]